MENFYNLVNELKTLLKEQNIDEEKREVSDLFKIVNS